MPTITSKLNYWRERDFIGEGLAMPDLRLPSRRGAHVTRLSAAGPAFADPLPGSGA